MDTWGVVGESPEEARSPVVSLDPPAHPLRECRAQAGGKGRLHPRLLLWMYGRWALTQNHDTGYPSAPT